MLKVSYCDRSVCRPGLVRLSVNFFFKRNLLNHLSKFHNFTWMFPMMPSFNINGSTQPNSRAARAEIFSWTTGPNSKLFHRIQGSYTSGKSKFFQGQGIFCCVREKWFFAKLSGKCQGILQPPVFIKWWETQSILISRCDGNKNKKTKLFYNFKKGR